MIQRAESLDYVKDQLGHSSIQIIVDFYGHLVPGVNRGAVDRLADAPAATYAQPRRRYRTTSVIEMPKKVGAGGGS